MAIKIVGARKPGGLQNPHEAVSHYQWVEDGTAKTGITERATVVGWVEGKQIPAYVQAGLSRVNCYVRQSAHGTKFLQTQTDNRWTNNILNLPEV